MRAMYAVVRDNRFDPRKRAQGDSQVAEFQSAHADRAGYCGSVTLDAGGGRELTLTLWRSRDEAESARIALAPAIERLLVPLMAEPSILVGVGEVIFDDLAVPPAR